jgi:hypothetical protein
MKINEHKKLNMLVELTSAFIAPVCMITRLMSLISV